MFLTSMYFSNTKIQQSLILEKIRLVNTQLFMLRYYFVEDRCFEFHHKFKLYNIDLSFKITRSCFLSKKKLMSENGLKFILKKMRLGRPQVGFSVL